MTPSPSLSEASLAREALRRIAEGGGLLERTAHVMKLIAEGSSGLGEVLQDYARQTSAQLNEAQAAMQRASSGMPREDDKALLEQFPFILKTIKTVLERTPPAMQRNKAESLGAKNAVSRAQVVELAHQLAGSGEMNRLFASDNSAQLIRDVFALGEAAQLAAMTGDAGLLSRAR